MTYSHILFGTSAAVPVVRRLAPSDLFHSLARGVDDFVAMPSHAIFLCVIYPLLGILLVSMTLGNSLLPLAFPIAAGFALVGPLAAIGLYELSRRREAGLDSSPSHVFDVLHSPSLGAIVALGLLLTAIFLIWLAVAEGIYIANFGYKAPASIRQFADDVLNTSAGWNLICRDRRRLPVRRGGAHDQRRLLSAAPRPRRRRAGSAAHVDPRRCRQSGHDGPVGLHRRRAAGDRLDPVLPRPDRGHAGARPCHLASLSPGGRARCQSEPGLSADGEEPALRCGLPSALFPTRR